MQDPVQREFFQGFLQQNKADGPMRFINDVNELILQREPAVKNKMIQKIVKKYFPDPDEGVESVCVKNMLQVEGKSLCF